MLSNTIADDLRTGLPYNVTVWCKMCYSEKIYYVKKFNLKFLQNCRASSVLNYGTLFFFFPFNFSLKFHFYLLASGWVCWRSSGWSGSDCYIFADDRKISRNCSQFSVFQPGMHFLVYLLHTYSSFLYQFIVNIVYLWHTYSSFIYPLSISL